jgi:hypothetical protein
MGVPNGVKFDEAKFDEDFRYSKFNKKWFSTDWDNDYTMVVERWDADKKKDVKVRIPDFDTIFKEQEALARKYGFDLQKDIYNGKWAKYDTAFTQKVKAMKQDARVKKKAFWDAYGRINDTNLNADGTKKDKYFTGGTKFIQKKRIEWEKTKQFIKNPYMADILQDWFFKGDVGKINLDLTDPKKYLEYMAYIESGQALTDAKEAGLAKYRATPKGKFWEEYHRLKKIDKGKASDFYQDNFKEEYAGADSEMNKAVYDKSAKGKFWNTFFDFDNDSQRFDYYRANYKPAFGGEGGKALTKEELNQEQYEQEYEEAGYNEKGRDEHTGY